MLVVFVMLLSSLAVGQPGADASELAFAKDDVLRLGESCPTGTTDVGHPADFPRRLAICRPDGFVPIATPIGSSAMCDLAVEAGVFGVWREGDPVSLCLHRYSRPVPEAGCSAFAIETILFDRLSNANVSVCASPILVKGATPANRAVAAVSPICVNDDVLLADDDAANLGVGEIFSGADGRDYVVTTGAWCGFGCVDGFDINCDGKLGDYCPQGTDRRTVAGTKACLAYMSSDTYMSSG